VVKETTLAVRVVFWFERANVVAVPACVTVRVPFVGVTE
jgi:hypothetical protein